MFQLLADKRQSGKTRRLALWVRAGRKIVDYPGWTRIIVTFDERQAQYIRVKYRLDYHQVYSWNDYREMRGQYQDLEVGIDNLDMFIKDMFQRTGPAAKIAVATMTAEKVVNFHDLDRYETS